MGGTFLLFLALEFLAVFYCFIVFFGRICRE